MDVETFQSIHRYGAILSIVAIVGAVLAYVLGGSLQPLVFPLGFSGPLAGFYFIGAVCENHSKYSVMGEELLRGVAWYGMRGCQRRVHERVSQNSCHPSAESLVATHSLQNDTGELVPRSRGDSPGVAS
jgi:hypothetical protein